MKKYPVGNTNIGIYVIAVLVGTLVIPITSIINTVVNAQSATTAPEQQPPSFGSKYMRITNANMFQNGNMVSIGGVMENNSTDITFTVPEVVAVLYNQEGRIITTNSEGLSFGFEMKPGEKKAFSMTVNVPSGEIVSSYYLLPGGSASPFS